MWLVPGSVYERGEGELVHNTCLVLSPEGELVASYRKVFPWQPHESSAPGDRFVTFDIPDVGRLGLSICYDGSFPETCRQLAWMGAEVVLQVEPHHDQRPPAGARPGAGERDLQPALRRVAERGLARRARAAA